MERASHLKSRYVMIPYMILSGKHHAFNQIKLAWDSSCNYGKNLISNIYISLVLSVLHCLNYGWHRSEWTFLWSLQYAKFRVLKLHYIIKLHGELYLNLLSKYYLLPFYSTFFFSMFISIYHQGMILLTHYYYTN